MCVLGSHRRELTYRLTPTRLKRQDGILRHEAMSEAYPMTPTSLLHGQ